MLRGGIVVLASIQKNPRTRRRGKRERERKTSKDLPDEARRIGRKFSPPARRDGKVNCRLCIRAETMSRMPSGPKAVDERQRAREKEIENGEERQREGARQNRENRRRDIKWRYLRILRIRKSRTVNFSCILHGENICNNYNTVYNTVLVI